jgi:uncharacterized protein (TIGR03435 family)
MTAFLEASLIRPLGLVAAAWLLIRLCRVQHPASRHAVWTAVLVGMLLLPVASAFGPRWTLAVLPAPPATAMPPTQSVTPAAPVDTAIVPTLSDPDFQAPLTDRPGPAAWPPVETLMVWAYLIGVGAIVLYRIPGWFLLQRVLSRARARRPPCLRESEDVVTPVAVGLMRPAVLLPAGWRTWTVRTRRAVLAHEFAHLRRRDTLVAALARLVTTVFWFHPVAWWVSRQTSTLAELACDAVALQRVGDPGGYSRVLVEFAHAVSRAGHRVALPGLAIASGSGIENRVDQVFLMSSGTMRRLIRPRVLLPIVGLPVIGILATIGLGAHAPQQAATTATFEVVSIKPCAGLPPASTGRGQNPRFAAVSPGYAFWGCVTLSELANQAYISDDRPLLNRLNPRSGRDGDTTVVRGGPSWVYDERFAIEVRANGAADRTALTGAMLRAMLEDRFQLKVHRATEEQPMFALTVAKTGLKVTPTSASECWVRPAGSTPRTPAPSGFEGKPSCGNVHVEYPNDRARYAFTGITPSGFAESLSGQAGRYVLDRTDLDGRFNITLEYVPDDASTIFRAVETLGLKLEPTKGLAEYLQIDRVQKPRPDASLPQAGGNPEPRFDVVSIKPCPDASTAQTGRGAGPNLAQTSPGHVSWACVTLAALADQAYAGWDFPLLNRKDAPLAFENFGRRARPDDDTKRVRGGPAWVYTERFAIEATASVDVISPAGGNLLRLPPAMNRALRAMLADRFKLQLRRETEERPMYALTIAKSGLKARARGPEDCVVPPADARGRPRADGFWEGQWLCGTFLTAPRDRLERFWAGERPGSLAPASGPNRRIEYRGVPLAKVAEYLSDAMDRFVLDKTVVSGEFLFAVEYTTNEQAPGGGMMLVERPTGPGADRQPRVPEGRGETVFQAFDAVGLKIEPTKGPAEYLVIDRAERPAPDAPVTSAPSTRSRPPR